VKSHDFLQSHPGSSNFQRDIPTLVTPKRRRFRRWFLLLVAAVLTLILVVTLVGVGFLIDGGLRAKQALQQAETAGKAADFATANAALDEVIAGLEEMQSAFPWLRFLNHVPWLGKQLAGTQAALDTSLDTLSIVADGLTIAEEVLATASGADDIVVGADGSREVRPYADLSSEEKRLLLTGLASSLPELRDMQVRLRLAQADLERLRAYELTPALENSLTPLYELIPDLLTSIDVLVPFAAIAPQYGGLQSDKQFLVLFLNNMELRPGGGFIGVYGLMVMRDGQIANMVTGDSYSIDAYVQGHEDYHVNPPPPLVSYLNQPVWYFRDAAWSPDFEQSARDAVQLLRQEVAYGGQPVPEIHGVVGITPTFISRLLDFTGPITVEGQTFTSTNVGDLLEYQVEQGFVDQGLPAEQRKEIVSKLTEQMVDELLAMPPSSWPDLFRALHAGFDQKEFALMSYDTKTQAALEDNGWAGVLNPAGSDDVLMVVDANLAALKTDPVVKRSVDYHVNKQGDHYQATATIKYDHRGSFNWKTTRYRTYTRIFVPQGAKLLAASGSLKDDKTRNPGLAPGSVDIADEFGMTSFGAFIAIEPGQSGTLSFTYELPSTVTSAIEHGAYRLLALKQLGAGDNLLTLNLDFGTTLASATPAEDPDDFGDKTYTVTTQLETDQLFTVRLD
jgi:hypothetical protein